jgi:AbrB family looped-hinge helix DNA binding protein
VNKHSESKSFSIEAVVSCDERGQLVLPKELRRKLGINPGDKLALMNFSMTNDNFCLTLIKTDALNQLVKIYLDPIVQQMK